MAKKKTSKKLRAPKPPGGKRRNVVVLHPPRRTTRLRYKRNFLKQVIARLDFVTQMPTLSEGLPLNVLAPIKSIFPIREERKQVLQQFMFSTSAGLRRSNDEVFQSFYYSKDRSKHFTVTPEFMAVKYEAYESFEVLERDFITAMDAVYAALGALPVHRLGLRYIDNIEFPKERDLTNWSAYIQPGLLTCFDLPDDKRMLSRVFNVLEMNYGDMQLRFQFGMPNPDYPAVLARKQFVLDFDAFCTGVLTREQITDDLRRFHDKINDAFESVITDGLRKKMGIVNA